MWDNLFRKSDEDAQVAEALRGNYIFQSLTRRQMALVKGTVHVRLFQAGETIFRQGEVGVGMYILLRGVLEVFVEDVSEEEGPVRPQLVTRLRGGDFLGELALVENNSRRTATAIAAEESLLIGFFKPDLFEILERQPATGVKILLRLSEVLGRRLKETTQRVNELKEDVRRLNEKL